MGEEAARKLLRVSLNVKNDNGKILLPSLHLEEVGSCVKKCYTPGLDPRYCRPLRPMSISSQWS